MGRLRRCLLSRSWHFWLTHSVIKTRMQSLDAKKNYKNALHCAYRIATEEGILKFWKGTVPRLGRLVVSRRWGQGREAGPSRRLPAHPSPPTSCSRCTLTRSCPEASSSPSTKRSIPWPPRSSRCPVRVRAVPYLECMVVHLVLDLTPMSVARSSHCHQIHTSIPKQRAHRRVVHKKKRRTPRGALVLAR